MLYGSTHKENYMPYGPTHKEICLMGLLTKKNYMPYGPTYKKNLLYALWAYLQNKKNILLSHEPMCVTE